jgi:hypothetical protein
VAIKLSHGWPTALWLARLLAACACLAFLLLAIRASWSGSPWPLLGVLLAITPMVLFVGSVINPSGLEVSAAVAFAAAALRIARDPANSPRWVWILFAASGAATILAWQLGPVFVGIDLLLLATMIGLGGIRSAANRARGSALLAAGVLSAALVAYASWSLSSGLLHSTFRVSPLGHSLVLGIKQLGPVLRQSVGDFGLVAVPVPDAILAGWLLLVLALAIGSLVVGSRRDRALLAAVVALAVAFPVLFYAWIYRFTGFGLQGRYVLPLFVLVPFVAGEALERSGRQLPGAVTEWIPAIAIGAVAVLQLAAWWVSARAAAGAHDSDWFLAHATWKPPLGWWPWTAAAVLGSVSLATPSVLKAWSAVRLMYAVEPEHGARSGSQGR